MKKKLKKLTTRSLDKIYDVSKKICNEWNTQTLPLNTLNEILKMAILKKSISEMDDFVDSYNNILLAIKEQCEGKAKSMDNKDIPLSYIKLCIDTVKKSFIKSLYGKSRK